VTGVGVVLVLVGLVALVVIAGFVGWQLTLLAALGSLIAVVTATGRTD
jgi:hypothetical protein